VLLDRDVVTGDPGEIGAARAVATWIDGERVHES
jgi:predicted amidohydrolase YtcJ